MFAFCRSMVCLLILLTLSLAEQKFLILMKSSLSTASFMDHAFGVVSKKSLPYARSSRFSPMLPSSSLLQFYIQVCVQVHFENNLCIYIHLHEDDQLSQHNLLKRLSLLLCTAFAPLSKINQKNLCLHLSSTIQQLDAFGQIVQIWTNFFLENKCPSFSVFLVFKPEGISLK